TINLRSYQGEKQAERSFFGNTRAEEGHGAFSFLSNIFSIDSKDRWWDSHLPPDPVHRTWSHSRYPSDVWMRNHTLCGVNSYGDAAVSSIKRVFSLDWQR